LGAPGGSGPSRNTGLKPNRSQIERLTWPIFTRLVAVYGYYPHDDYASKQGSLIALIPRSRWSWTSQAHSTKQQKGTVASWRWLRGAVC
jgi:hypothetical protein